MSDFEVIRAGTDVYGRPVYQTRFYNNWEQARFDNLGFSLPYAQGGFMTRLGGGADQSSGAHDLAKCCDYITEHLTRKQSDAVVREFRDHGGAAYRRDRDAKHGGMPPHLHNTLGADGKGSSMANLLWASYVSGGDALGAAPGRPGGAPDYEYRPSPLVLVPPEEDMPLSDNDAQKVAQAILKTKVTVNRLDGKGTEQRYIDSILANLFNAEHPLKK